MQTGVLFCITWPVGVRPPDAASRRNVTIVLRDSDVPKGMEELHEEFFGIAKRA